MVDSTDLAQAPGPLQRAGVTVVVLGASGDLAKRKCFPALGHLTRRGLLPGLALVGVARSDVGQAAFKGTVEASFAARSASSNPQHMRRTSSVHRRFEDLLVASEYVQAKGGSYAEPATGAATAAAIERVEALAEARQIEELTTGADTARRGRLFYLALPSSAFEDALHGLAAAGLLEERDGLWVRVVLEKPFGRDHDDSAQLMEALAPMVEERQICRIDHYLGKEMVQNILIMRFDNAWLEPTLNRHHVANVQITLKETLLLEGRAGYFDDYGIVRDVMQNHLLQVLALLAMERPVSAAGDDVRDEKTKVLRCMRPVEGANAVVAQYEGYRDDVVAAGGRAGSTTPTFATMVVYIDNERWHGVPFIVKAGKALNQSKVEVRVQYKEVARPFHAADAASMRNELVLRVQPSLAMYLKIVTKKPGLEVATEMKELDFTVEDRDPGADITDAYESLIFEAIRGHMSAFVRGDELLASWKVVSKFLRQIDAGELAVHTHPKNSRGPEESDRLIGALGFKRTLDSYRWSPPGSRRGSMDVERPTAALEAAGLEPSSHQIAGL